MYFMLTVCTEIFFMLECRYADHWISIETHYNKLHSGFYIFDLETTIFFTTMVDSFLSFFYFFLFCVPLYIYVCVRECYFKLYCLFNFFFSLLKIFFSSSLHISFISPAIINNLLSFFSFSNLLLSFRFYCHLKSKKIEKKKQEINSRIKILKQQETRVTTSNENILPLDIHKYLGELS